MSFISKLFWSPAPPSSSRVNKRSYAEALGHSAYTSPEPPEGSQKSTLTSADEVPDLLGAESSTIPNLNDAERSTGSSPHQQDRPTSCCKSCEDIEDSSDWTPVVPAVSMANRNLVYTHSSPSGRFECTVSSLRWVCAMDVTLQYHFNDHSVFRKELAMLQYVPIGPLMDIKVLSGGLLEAHLPHFACLDGSDTALKEAVRVLHAVNGGVHLETCELTRFHAKLTNPSFSLTEVLVKWGFPMKTHLEVLIYRTRITPLVLLTYVVPRDESMIQAVEKEIKKNKPNAIQIIKPRPDMSMWFNTKCGLKASTRDARITPLALTLEYTSHPYFFEVAIRNVGSSFDLELVSEGQSIWKATLDDYEYDEIREVAYSHRTQLAASGYSSDAAIGGEGPSTTRASGVNGQDGQMTSKTSKECLTRVRPELIKRMSRAVLKGLMAELQAQRPSVINRREAQAILQRSSEEQDQVTSFVDVLLNKGEKACGIMFSLLRELDRYLYEDLGL